MHTTEALSGLSILIMNRCCLEYFPRKKHFLTFAESPLIVFESGEDDAMQPLCVNAGSDLSVCDSRAARSSWAYVLCVEITVIRRENFFESS